MVVKKNIHKTNVKAPHLPEGNFLAGRIGFWALVKEVNSINNTVTVISDTGFIFKNIPVKSDEWVTINDSKDYIPSQRNLPPINSRVFVLTPTYSATGAFILCSGFSRGDENIRKLWASGEGELEDKNNCRETKTQGGWDITEEYANGNYKVASNDEEIIFTANTTEDSEKSQVKEISLKAWDNTIIVNEDGISITDKNGNTIESTSNGISITDSEGNKIESGVDNQSKKYFKVQIEKKEEGVVTEGASLLLNSDKATITVGTTTQTKIEQTASSVKINGHLEVGV